MLNSNIYFQFLRFYTSKCNKIIVSNLPKVCAQTFGKELRYTEVGLSEDDISAFFNFIFAAKSSNVGFSRKFLKLMLSNKNLRSAELLVPVGNAWAVPSIDNTSIVISKKYVINSDLITSLRKLLRKEGIDFYLDQSSFVLRLVVASCGSKDAEILVRFFGIPIRFIRLYSGK